MNRTLNERTSGNGAVALWFHTGRLRRAVPEQQQCGGNPSAVTFRGRHPLSLSFTMEHPGDVRLVIENAQNGTYIIEASTDLLNWTPLSTNISDGGLVLFKDTAATNFNYRFYRARSK